jgi:DNA-binding MarR family transcriptional regulator
LVFVDDNPGCGMGDVARYLNVAMTTMSSAIDRLGKRWSSVAGPRTIAGQWR